MMTPVTLLTGFLGSGKTTLLARALADPGFADTAVVVNEWGEAAIDHALLRHASGEVLAVAGGCACCAMASEVAGALRELHFLRAERRIAPYRRVVIETTGLADPAPLAATLAGMPVTAVRHAFAGIVTTVDALHGEAVLEAHEEARRQAAMADRIVVTKGDLAPAAVAPLRGRLARLAPHAEVVSAGEIGAAEAFEIPVPRIVAARPLSLAHDASIGSFVWSSAEPRAWPRVESALREICARTGARLLRMKGLVNVAREPGPRVVHAVGHTLYPSTRLPGWPDPENQTRLAFIGQGLEPREIASILQE